MRNYYSITMGSYSSECYVNNVYIYGQKATHFYIDTLLCFKQYIYLLNHQLAGADIEGILTSLFMTLTNSVTVPPNLLQLTIANVMMYIASNCTIANVYNLSCMLKIRDTLFVLISDR